MSRLIIAEKPSLARAIAAALPKPHHNHSGYIQASNGDVITWCVGHLLEQADPDHYDANYKKWRLADLPILPTNWILLPKKNTAAQLKIIKQLLPQSSVIIHAGDPDREGQLLVDEVINYCGVTAAQQQQIQRLLVNDLNVAAVKKALDNLQSNQNFKSLSISALARSRADWLYGINMSRAYTLLGQQVGYQGVLSVGRVQTPILGLVVNRDQSIAEFKPKPFYQLDAVIPYQDVDIIARWQPSQACEPWQDEEGRVLSRRLAENVAARITGQAAVLEQAERKRVKQHPPLAYSLSALQIDAAKRFNLSALEVLDCCQNLYEKHKVITYPRSDCRYLPVAHWPQSQAVCAGLAKMLPDFSSALANANFQLKSKCWDDKKVGAHHAIIPTGKTASLSGREADIFQLIARQYLAQFYPAAEFDETKLQFLIAGGLFVAKAKIMHIEGWLSLFNHNRSETAALPAIAQGTRLTCEQAVIKDCMTEPPRHFTEATLLQAMTGISRFVSDPALKQVLKETDGLGTEATRASIIALLFQRGLLSKQGKQIRATPNGLKLIHALPAQLTQADMTAHWERALQEIAEKQHSYVSFMDNLQQQLQQLIAQIKCSPVPIALQGLSNTQSKMVRSKGRSRYAKSGTNSRRKVAASK